MSDYENNLNNRKNYLRLRQLYDTNSESDYSSDEETDIIENVIERPLYYPLTYTWVLYDHIKSDSNTYESSTRKICEISDVVKFWQVFNNYPLPSKIFNNGNQRPVLNSKEISSLSLFKNGVVPKWEDPVNKNGADISKRKFNKKNAIEELDEDWITLAMYCVSSTFDYGITGIRVVDSSSFKKNEHTGRDDFKLLYRVELWFDNCTNRKVIEDNFKIILNINDPNSIHYKEHLK